MKSQYFSFACLILSSLAFGQVNNKKDDLVCNLKVTYDDYEMFLPKEIEDEIVFSHTDDSLESRSGLVLENKSGVPIFFTRANGMIAVGILKQVSDSDRDLISEAKVAAPEGKYPAASNFSQSKDGSGLAFIIWDGVDYPTTTGISENFSVSYRENQLLDSSTGKQVGRNVTMDCTILSPSKSQNMKSTVKNLSYKKQTS